MQPDWGSVFDNFGIKQVTRTDKSKNAYVLGAEQVLAIDAAGIKPSPVRPGKGIAVNLLLDSIKTVVASYYHAKRKAPGRTPEPRMGKEFIRSWLGIGDWVLIGNIDKRLFAAKLPAGYVPDSEVAAAIAGSDDALTKNEILRRAKRAKGKPKRRTVTQTVFARDQWVIMGALVRADGKCESPKCEHQLFIRDNGDNYLEVHHIIPLGEGGDDTLINAAALCPHCHREHHFGRQRHALRKALAARIRSLPG